MLSHYLMILSQSLAWNKIQNNVNSQSPNLWGSGFPEEGLIPVFRIEWCRA